MRALTILGASVRAAAFSARRAGFAPYAIDLFADRDLAAIGKAVKIARYPRDFLAALAAAPQAPWMYAGGLESHPRLIDYLASIRPLIGNRGEALRRVRDPLRLRDAAIAAGCLFPTTLPGGSTELDASDRKWLIKPRRSSGGIGIRFASTPEVTRPPRGTYLQEYVSGAAASAVFVTAQGKADLLGATKQLLGSDFGLERPFLYAGSIGPLALSKSETARLRDLGNVLAERLGLTGLFNVDFVHNEQGLWPVEVNPRYSASMEIVERVSGLKLIEHHVAACESGQRSATAPSGMHNYAGKAVVYATSDATVPATLDELAADWNSRGAWPGLADLPRVGDVLAAGQPAVTVFAEGSTPAAVETELRRRVTVVTALLTDP